jgi:hypothetical protein
MFMITYFDIFELITGYCAQMPTRQLKRSDYRAVLDRGGRDYEDQAEAIALKRLIRHRVDCSSRLEPALVRALALCNLLAYC